MTIELNGAARDLPDGTTLAALLTALGVDRAGTAVAVNGRVVRGTAHDGYELSPGDVVEIVRAASGG